MCTACELPQKKTSKSRPPLPRKVAGEPRRTIISGGPILQIASVVAGMTRVAAYGYCGFRSAGERSGGTTFLTRGVQIMRETPCE